MYYIISMLHSHSYLINILLPSCTLGGNDCLHCLFTAVQSRYIHCILQPHKYPLNVTLFPLVMSKLMKNVFWIWTYTFRCDALPPSLCDGMPAGIIQRLHARSSVTLTMDAAHFSEPSCQPRNLHSVKTGRSSDLP